MFFFISACKKDPGTEIPYNPTPYQLPLIEGFRPGNDSAVRPMTVEGIALGRKLFFDPILSKDFTISCSSCHNPANGFADDKKFSLGVMGGIGTRNSMSLFNLAWAKGIFWDGRVHSLPEQALVPVAQPNEMDLTWDEAVSRLKDNDPYSDMFYQAFGTREITKELTTKALAQFELTLISYNSPYDKYLRGEANLSAAAQRGQVIFNTEKGDCFHCHAPAFRETIIDETKIFSNNGMDEAATPDDFADKGLGATTHNPNDNGKFKIPSLRNIAFTAPYMHDGRFNTLDDVINSYDLGPKISPSVEPIMIVKANYRLDNYGHWGLALSDQEKQDLKAFILTMSDSTVLTNPDFQKP